MLVILCSSFLNGDHFLPFGIFRVMHIGQAYWAGILRKTFMLSTKNIYIIRIIQLTYVKNVTSELSAMRRKNTEKIGITIA